MKYEFMGVETQEVSCSSTDAEDKWAALLVWTQAVFRGTVTALLGNSETVLT
jgi:hypothetical protein